MEFHKSAEELQTLRRNLTKAQMPCRSGPKHTVRDGSEEAARILEDQHEGLERVLSEERVLRKGNISVGHWNNEKQLVEISVAKGVHWNVFGKMVQGQLVLQPEEALYLLDHGMLEIYYNDLPISLQQGYELLLSQRFSLHHYVVYSYLRNLGFIVLRHKRKNMKYITCRKQEDKETNSVELQQTADEQNHRHRQPVVLKQELLEDDKHSIEHDYSDKEFSPLVHPRHATSLGNILDRLQIIKGQTVADASMSNMQQSCRYEIYYDVFQPQKKFKKSDPGLPNHSICICKFSEPPPTIGEMNLLAAKSYPVPLKYAVIDGRDVSFYAVLDVQLPVDAEGI